MLLCEGGWGVCWCGAVVFLNFAACRGQPPDVEQVGVGFTVGTISPILIQVQQRHISVAIVTELVLVL